MKLNITPAHFKELIVKGYSVDHILLLKWIEEMFDISSMRKDSAKIDALYSSLLRKGLITADEKLTTIGKELILFIDTPQFEKLMKRKPASAEFDEWWKTYPGTDTFTYKDRKFQGSRSLRVDKDNCRLKFDKILIEGEVNAHQMIEALKLDVLQKKEMSLKEGKNKLIYMQNSLTYLNQKSYDPMIELLSKGETIKESQDKYDGVNL